MPDSQLAHSNDEMACYTCHLSWTTSCAGCHLPIEANQHTERHQYEGETTRNYATYNPEIAREDMFQLGRHSTVKNNIIAPIASRSAVVLSSTNINREHIYVQQPPVSSAGFSSQAFSPHYPHTERRTETKTCTDCRISAQNDNNTQSWRSCCCSAPISSISSAIIPGSRRGKRHPGGARHRRSGTEPQAVIGNYLHRYAYPDDFAKHLANDRKLEEAYDHRSNAANCIQLRGEYLYVAEGAKGMRVYDVANIDNKGFSERIITAPVSPLGQDTHIASANATCVVLPTSQPINPPRNAGLNESLNFSENYGPIMRGANEEEVMHPIYNYAYVTDAVEGLILVNVNTLQDQEPLQQFLLASADLERQGHSQRRAHRGDRRHQVLCAGRRGCRRTRHGRPAAPAARDGDPDPATRARRWSQFRYLFVADGARSRHRRHHQPRPAGNRAQRPCAAHRRSPDLCVAHLCLYCRRARRAGDRRRRVGRPQPRIYQMYTADGKLNDARDVVVAATNACRSTPMSPMG